MVGARDSDWLVSPARMRISAGGSFGSRVLISVWRSETARILFMVFSFFRLYSFWVVLVEVFGVGGVVYEDGGVNAGFRNYSGSYSQGIVHD